MGFSRSTLIGLSLATAHAPAFACSVVVPEGYEGSAQQLRDVRRSVEASTAIIDGQVVRPYVEGKQNALVLAYRVLKGPKQNFFEVGRGDSCSIVLDRVGERERMVLSAGPKVYLLYDDQAGARIEDRILGSDRRKAWPFVAGHGASAQ
jgi:hypothetical protein